MISLSAVDRAARFAEFLSASGPIGTDILKTDWSQTSLGPIAGWPDALRTTFRIVLTSRQRMVFFWGPDLLQFYNETYQPIIDGMPGNPLGAPFKSFWAEIYEGVRPFYESAMAGEGTWQENLPLLLTRNGVTQETYWTFSYSPLYDDDGRIAGFLNVVTETTQAERDRIALAKATEDLSLENERTRQMLAERVSSEKRLRILQRELSHRMKNTLAMVQAIVAQSLRHSTSTENASHLAMERIQALARSQDALTANDWNASGIHEVVEAALAPYLDRPGRITIEGPSAHLTAPQTMGLSLALHELATNAIKYGSLSCPEGRVAVRWQLEPEGDFGFDWSEGGGPAVGGPARSGFGSRLTEKVVPTYFHGRARLAFAREGLTYALRGRLSKVTG